ncbi:hypothetical protein PG997_011462 [Apiospora hydei]|uniref:Uncharacterized protein n=1 Tax=Apiospora hydei TaxID=1337664 RepID=A0ABR1VJ54_9PEZI
MHYSGLSLVCTHASPHVRLKMGPDGSIYQSPFVPFYIPTPPLVIRTKNRISTRLRQLFKVNTYSSHQNEDLLRRSPGPARGPGRPRPQADKHEVTACACANANGDTFVPGVCLYIRGREYTADGKKYCFPGATDAERMEDAFSASFCAQEYPNYPQQACVKANACPLIGDYQQPC